LEPFKSVDVRGIFNLKRFFVVFNKLKTLNEKQDLIFLKTGSKRFGQCCSRKKIKFFLPLKAEQLTGIAECNKSAESEYYEYYTEPGSSPLLLSSSELHLVASHYSPATGQHTPLHSKYLSIPSSRP
jgi:hypothetical protein